MIWASLLVLPIILTSVLIIFYAERKGASFIQDRLGPTEVGLWGTLQPLADLVKLIQKEDIIPQQADRWLFKLAPVGIFAVVFTAFALLPLGSLFEVSALETGIFLWFAIISLDVAGLLAAGWSSNSKYALLGSMRTVAQIVSYEIPATLVVITVVLWAGTWNLNQIAELQSSGRFGNGFLAWSIFSTPHLWIAYIIFYIATLAECNRAPFDLPEAESELVAGFHVEYSGFRFAIFFLSEYAMMLLVSLVSAYLFFGGWNSPFPNIGQMKWYDWTMGKPGEFSAWAWSFFWLYSKAFFFMLTMIWIRWTFPRIRIDQMMSLCWKYLIPFSLLAFLIGIFWRIYA